MFIDTHCHINIMVKETFDRELTSDELTAAAAVIEQAKAAGVQTIINVGTSLIESLNCIALAQRYPEVFATVGIHPCDATASWREDFKVITQKAKEWERLRIVGIGEVGLDFYHKPFDAQRQKDCFKAHIELALEHNLGLSIHVRDAGEELLYVLDEYRKQINRAVIHCFSQSQDFANTVLEWGFYLGIDAPITYPKNEQLRNVVANTPLTSLVLETDSPFLPPQELRGKKNHPAYIPKFVSWIADLKGVSVEEVAAITTRNAQRLFGLKGR
jgi:TatD DNase family protein